MDLIFHLGALPSVPRSVQDPVGSNLANQNGTLNLLMAAKEAKVERVVYASSSSVYGDAPEQPKREDMLPAPMSPYAVAKLAGEYYCQVFHRLYGLGAVPLRFFNVFGPRQDPSSQYAAVVPKFIAQARHGEKLTIFGDGEQSRDFTFILDVVQGCLLAAKCPRADGLVINVARGESISVNRWRRSSSRPSERGRRATSPIFPPDRVRSRTPWPTSGGPGMSSVTNPDSPWKKASLLPWSEASGRSLEGAQAQTDAQ